MRGRVASERKDTTAASAPANKRGVRMTEKMPYHRRQGHERSDGFEDALIFGDLKSLRPTPSPARQATARGPERWQRPLRRWYAVRLVGAMQRVQRQASLLGDVDLCAAGPYPRNPDGSSERQRVRRATDRAAGHVATVGTDDDTAAPWSHLGVQCWMVVIGRGNDALRLCCLGASWVGRCDASRSRCPGASWRPRRTATAY